VSETTTLAASFTVASDHPCIPGHFPGDPIVPAVLLLDLIFAALKAARPGTGRLRGIKVAKFMHPVRPDEEVQVLLKVSNSDPAVRFECRTHAGMVAVGVMLLEPPGSTREG
jgi:3-hydroxymyristoyl/3-hydroxydecanoyl-(acyl carrier protein) dehydratase